MTAEILYCGDTSLTSAASYLAGVMTHAGWEFDYLPSDVPLSRDRLGRGRRLLILSDYPAARVSAELQAEIVQQVQGGMGLLMIGGWESFHGLGGDWDATAVAPLFGLKIAAADDRQNSFSPALLHPSAATPHPILDGLPWDAAPPFVGGWNRVELDTATELLSIQQFEHWRRTDTGHLAADAACSQPGLTVHTVGSGRCAAFLSDVAPHWVGGFVDWGDQRVTAQAPGAEPIEVGDWYAQFWRQLLKWTGQQ